MRHTRAQALAVLLAALLLPGLVPAAESPPALPPPQRREVTDLLAKFRRAKAEPEQRTEVVDKILEIGGTAPALLHAQITQELAALEARYRADFPKQATQILRGRLRPADQQEVESLREAVLLLGSRANLTKEEIVSEGDPAMAKLAEWLLVSPDDVLKDAPALQAQREELTALGKHWQRVVDYLAAHPAPGGPAPVRTRSFENVLKADDQLGVLLPLAKEEAGRKTLAANADLEAKLDPEEASGIRDLNRMRLLLGLKPLKIDVALCEAARDHSKDMVTQKFFSHESPVSGKRTPWDRAKRFGTSASAENIAQGEATGPATIRQWFHSPVHHRNILANHSRVGLGRHEQTWTQMFG